MLPNTKDPFSMNYILEVVSLIHAIYKPTVPFYMMMASKWDLLQINAGENSFIWHFLPL